MAETGWRRPWAARLRPRGQVDVDRAVSPAAIVEAAVARVGAGPVGWAIELNTEVVRRIVSEVPALGGSPSAVEMLRRGNEATTLHVLFTLVDGPAAAAPAGAATLESVRELVHRAVPLDQVLRGVRVGHAATTEAFLQACAELVDPDTAAGEITAVSRDLFSSVDGLADAMIRTYLVEHEAWSTSVAAARADLVRSLLDDTRTPDHGEASRVLGYDLTRHHEAVVVWSEASNGDSTLQRAAIEALRARGATTTLVVPVTTGRLWAWGTVSPGGTRRTDSWEEVTEALSHRRVQAAFGTPADGVAGFRRSHREAGHAERLERLRRAGGRPPRSATTYADVAAVALLTTDLEAATDLVRRELGGLAARSPAMEALRTTLYHYINAERSIVDVAGRLHVARGTVTYRVKRAEDVLGHDVDDRRFALYTALTLVEELGDAVLGPVGADP
ncbi:PucR family transcriptional regulator [Cryptosporangium sp. NPDC051539]|uniref:PucR family transcriptional regulator n=1 Tax=Cryptosporangium sp. NPDC051539 TaxID=3363962 RepID=UPI0037872BE6